MGRIFTLLSFLVVAMGLSHSAHADCDLPWVFLDLGANTVIDTSDDTFDKVRYMPGAHEYLQNLRNKGYHVGLLVNIPEAWGKTQEEKFEATKKFIAGEWDDAIPLDWDQFDLGVAFPPTNAQRKPAPYLFDQAMKRAQEAGCEAVYQTALPEEVPAANKAGMVGIQVGVGTYDGSFYYPEARLRAHDFSIVHRELQIVHEE
jgi:FMN phosphatase YigB (HAD superfamily)